MIGISITKSTPWRGHTEEFSNVYHYDTADSAPAAQVKEFVDIIVAAERAVHATSVNFVRARAWSAGGSPEQNQTIGIWDLTGTGSASDAAQFNRESVYLVEYRTTRPSATGRPVTLKKFVHACSLLGDTDTSIMGGTVKVGSLARGKLNTYAQAVKTINTPNLSGGLIAPSGSGRRAMEHYVYDWVEHREFT